MAGQPGVQAGDGRAQPAQGRRPRPPDRRQLLPEPRLWRGAGSIEYGTDTTRAIIGVTFSGDAARFPDIRFIWSHAGGSAPFLAGRIDGGSRNAAKIACPMASSHEAKKFYYDTAGAANRGALASLLQLVPASQMLFGTDFPPGGTSLEIAKALADVGFFNESDLRAIERENAVRLLPRLAARP